MSQLVIKPGIATPFGAVAHHARQQAHLLVATWLAAIDRIGRWSRGPGEYSGHLEAAYKSPGCHGKCTGCNNKIGWGQQN
ncbi:hypothetical protein BST28_12480 [Mycolicibacter kumamotonensis]|uniref:Uncharacterized protein n=1 Tax=Mycolicibacter kumamotonensis TaxID=354243 RepID=A0A1X0E3Y7_9MYCO|nr:hypothetical protein [Mycolicibacter kumamotonensis]ORA79394.1 hypothetical protein BST28_12480 [Mycolicibacter kumamotonensis]